MFVVVITSRARLDIESAVEWWRENRSAEQAERWYIGIFAALESLSEMPQRCRLVSNHEQLGREVRQLLYGVGSSLTHRVFFGIDGQTVTIYRVLHTSQTPPEGPKDLWLPG